MAGPELSGQAETLEQGRVARTPSRHRRRAAVGLVLVLLLAAAAALVLDHEARGREGLAVARCVDDATSTVTFADRRADAISGYVRPALDAGPPPTVRRRLEGLISSTVAPVLPDVRRARDRCAQVRLLWFHDGLRTTRQDCLRLLGEDLAYLQAAADAGIRAFDPRSLPAGTCLGPGSS